MHDDDDEVKEKGSGLSRRSFLKVSGISLSVPLVMGHRVIRVAGAESRYTAPERFPLALTVNGKKYAGRSNRVTLLEALRGDLDLKVRSGVCDRAT